MSVESGQLKRIVEAALMASDGPVSISTLRSLFDVQERPETEQLRDVLQQIKADCKGRGIELQETASGHRFQVPSELSPWISRLWAEKAPRYSRAMLETVALIAYRQPVTRADIEEVRGVAVSSNIIRSLLEREWVRVVGHRDVPGRPELFATTRQFLDYFSLKSLDQLPSLAEIKDFEQIDPALDLLIERDDVESASEKGTGAQSVESEQWLSAEETVEADRDHAEVLVEEAPPAG